MSVIATMCSSVRFRLVAGGSTGASGESFGGDSVSLGASVISFEGEKTQINTD